MLCVSTPDFTNHTEHRSRRTSELLWLAPPVIRNEECTVECDQSLLQGVLAVLVDILLVVGDDALGNGLTDRIDLRGVTTTSNAHADVDLGELVESNDEERLVDLESQNLGLHEGERFAVHSDETFACLYVARQSLDQHKSTVSHTLQWATAMAVFFLPKL